MRTPKQLTPLDAIASGLAAGLVGTACMDTVRFLRQRRSGGERNPLRWEFAPFRTWKEAPDPGQVGKRLIEGFTQRELPDAAAWPVSTFMHWSYGALYGRSTAWSPARCASRPLGSTAYRSARSFGSVATSACRSRGSTSPSGSTTARPSRTTSAPTWPTAPRPGSSSGSWARHTPSASGLIRTGERAPRPGSRSIWSVRSAAQRRDVVWPRCRLIMSTVGVTPFDVATATS